MVFRSKIEIFQCLQMRVLNHQDLLYFVAVSLTPFSVTYSFSFSVSLSVILLPKKKIPKYMILTSTLNFISHLTHCFVRACPSVFQVCPWQSYMYYVAAVVCVYVCVCAQVFLLFSRHLSL